MYKNFSFKVIGGKGGYIFRKFNPLNDRYKIKIGYVYNIKEDRGKKSSTILHACQESRNVGRRFMGGYKKAFRELFFRLPTRAGIDNRARPLREDKPYLWMNVELDMIDVRGRPLWGMFLCDHWRRIRRLKFEMYGKYWGGGQDRDELHWVRSSIERYQHLSLREICVCVPGEESHLDLPREWLPEALGGRDGGWFEGWRAVECSTISHEEDGEEDMEGKTAPEGKVCVLVLRKINGPDGEGVYGTGN
ncbi:hypothetical protein B0T20DRAFT_389280 [Sordaria brevicollis]|uniref:Uncharacterized protein n=1 Tax=Sordaria brevicollis TaxID=83679 RepID=A0AAE0UEP2_SORBR|nr:hypothetical protein B0T20DRAFT_389280 [Sordaria brevicollis]